MGYLCAFPLPSDLIHTHLDYLKQSASLRLLQQWGAWVVPVIGPLANESILNTGVENEDGPDAIVFKTTPASSQTQTPHVEHRS